MRTSFRRGAVLGFVFGSVLLLAGCAAPSVLAPQGPAAERIAGLWWIMFGLAGAIYGAVVALLLIGLFRRRRVEPDSERPPSEGQVWILGGGVVLPTAILSLLFVLTLGTMAALAAPPSDALTVEMLGHQWWWEVRYPDAQVTTANELHIPAGRPVRLLLTSADVIHSFWVPELHGKMDLVPGRPNTFWIEARRPGIYRGQCAEYCGYQHAKMAFLVIAEPPDQFAAWLETQRRPAPTLADPLVQQGQQVFLGSSCRLCHTIRDTVAATTSGPDLTHLADRRTIAAGTLENTRENLANWIRNPQAIKPGNRMPPPDLTAEELQALVAYLESLE
ncbi:MAG TPA: cytochrome c oxidase subunit II [Roseiflexaceae bacterium]|nr:cytochrome c oxidase subunit II [Roseiflexaceae bacterium]